MIFYCKTPNLVVNSKKANRIIARFKGRELETFNPILIEKLKPYFRYKESPLEAFLRLKKEAVKKGINTNGMKQADLIKALEECGK